MLLDYKICCFGLQNLYPQVSDYKSATTVIQVKHPSLIERATNKTGGLVGDIVVDTPVRSGNIKTTGTTLDNHGQLCFPVR